MKTSLLAAAVYALMLVGSSAGAAAQEDHADHEMAGMAMQTETTTAAPAAPTPSNMKLTLDGRSLALDASYLIDNSLFVPYRAFAEGIGGQVGWDEATKTVTVQKGGSTIKLKIGSRNADVNGMQMTMVGPAQIIDGSTFVHSRFLAEAFGITVHYDDATRTVNLLSAGNGEATPVYHIDISNFSFSTPSITVEAGSTIVFTNHDKVKHNAVADNGSFETPLLEQGASASVKLTEPGEYTYFCQPHKSFMKGTIIVK
ncbi:cupredoxin domain-containing protein [Paenibacillus athensensis]|uniref:Plastocyanin n=1 Tax=Paenibacillus athensensis TaxID=1967502 RepID=A0A4Y8PT86_9BACL|nr:stalk domain-containing protein [Paenibacillus athensensis]MCD1258014.1 cupredoxin domain-containing protein [Paenibacillus athensensis]